MGLYYIVFYFFGWNLIDFGDGVNIVLGFCLDNYNGIIYIVGMVVYFIMVCNVKEFCVSIGIFVVSDNNWMMDFMLIISLLFILFVGLVNNLFLVVLVLLLID